MITPTRRGFLLGLLAAPVIVRVGSIMPVKAAPAESEILWITPAPNNWTPLYTWTISGYDEHGIWFVDKIDNMPVSGHYEIKPDTTIVRIGIDPNADARFAT